MKKLLPILLLCSCAGPPRGILPDRAEGNIADHVKQFLHQGKDFDLAPRSKRDWHLRHGPTLVWATHKVMVTTSRDGRVWSFFCADFKKTGARRFSEARAKARAEAFLRQRLSAFREGKYKYSEGGFGWSSEGMSRVSPAGFYGFRWVKEGTGPLWDWFENHVDLEVCSNTGRVYHFELLDQQGEVIPPVTDPPMSGRRVLIRVPKESGLIPALEILVIPNQPRGQWGKFIYQDLANNRTIRSVSDVWKRDR